VWGFNTNLAAPAVADIASGGAFVNDNASYDPGFLEQSRNPPGNLWPDTPNQALEPLWNSYTTTFEEELENLPLERVPSLETDLSIRSFSFKSSPEPAANFSASHWPGILPLDPFQQSDSTKVGHSIILPPAREADSRSWGLESLRGSPPGGASTMVDTDVSQVPLIFDFRDPVTEPQGHTPFVDRLVASSNLLQSQTDHNCNSQIVDAEVPASEWSFGQYLHSNRASLSLIGHLPPSSIELLPYPLQESEEACSSRKKALAGASGSLEQPALDHIVPWNCFVVEDGSGNVISPPLPHRKGARHGRLPPDKAKVIADRRRQGNTCMRCRVAKVEVSNPIPLRHVPNFDAQCDGYDPCQRCAKLGQSATLAQPCLKANFWDIVKSGTCNYICEPLPKCPKLLWAEADLVIASTTRH
jgi:hypothetical protein